MDKVQNLEKNNFIISGRLKPNPFWHQNVPTVYLYSSNNWIDFHAYFANFFLRWFFLNVNMFRLLSHNFKKITRLAFLYLLFFHKKYIGDNLEMNKVTFLIILIIFTIPMKLTIFEKTLRYIWEKVMNM